MLNIDELLQNVSRSDVMPLCKIRDEIRTSLNELGIFDDEYIQKLDGYKQINQICDLLRGRHIRWIREKTKLTNGAILVDIKFLDSGTHLLCKNPMGKMFQIKYDDCVIFQRMTADEILVAYAEGNLRSREPSVPLRPLPHSEIR